MARIKTIMLLLLAVCLCTMAVPEKQAKVEPVLAEYHLGFGLQPSGNTSWFSCGIVKVHEGKILDVKHITPKMFVMMGTGAWDSPANPERINIFEKYDLESCITRFDSIGNDYEFVCYPVSNIWKLRYNKHPAPTEMMKDPFGWGALKYKPSEGQLNVLSQYGIKHLVDFTYGDNAFRLLRDMNNPAWVASYRGS